MNILKQKQGSNENATGQHSDKPEREVLVGLDIGTTKVCCIVASQDESGENLTILGIGQSPSDGLNRGVVVNIEKTVKAIRQAVEQAEQRSGIQVQEVYVGIAGDHIQSFQTTGIIAISNPDREITRMDVARLIDDTRKIAIPSDRKILHIIPQDFIIDGQDGISDPVGMSGIRMEGNVHIVTGLVTAAQNIHRCVERAGLTVRDIVLEPLASSFAVLDKEEKEIGVALIDIGGGTTDLAIFSGGIIRDTAIIGIAGRQVTEDIRRGLGILAAQAERIKREYGHAHSNSILRDEIFMIPGVGGRKPTEVTKSLLCQIIQPRMEEILEFAFAEIKRSGFVNHLAAGIVLTGGGSLLRGVDELAQDIFGMPVKIGIPASYGYGGLAPEAENPQYATGVGLINYALSRSESDLPQPVPFENGKKSPSVIDKVKAFFQEF